MVGVPELSELRCHDAANGRTPELVHTDLLGVRLLMKVVWQATSHQKSFEREYTSRIEAEQCVKELLEMGRQFHATWLIEPHIEGDK